MSVKGIDTHEQFRLNRRINDNGKTERRCTKCLEWKEENLDNYYMMNKNKPEMGFTPACRTCNQKRATIHYYENIDTERERSQRPEVKELRNTIHKKWRIDKVELWQEYYSDYQQRDYVKEKYKEYNKNHRDHDITTAEWQKELEIFNYKCAYCGITEEEHLKLYKQKLHKDHADHEGANDLSNALPSCRSCNDRKWIFPMEEWFRKQNFFTEEKLEFINWWVIEGYKDYIGDKPPYRILRKRNEGLTTYHFELWTVDNKRNIIERIDIKPKKKDIDTSLIKIG